MNQISLFVDDERSPYQGWTLARDYHEAMCFFEEQSGYDIRDLSLDWHLGHRTLNGLDVARDMLDRVRFLKLNVFDNLEAVWLHSSVRSAAVEQANLFAQAAKEGLIPSHCRIRLNQNCHLIPRSRR